MRKNQHQNYVADLSYPLMKRGINCRVGYNPVLNKYCTKCPKGSTHHEFECALYYNYSSEKCAKCKTYNHHSSDCKEDDYARTKN